MGAQSEARRHAVAVVYPFFAHYRGPVNRALMESRAHHYLFVGDTKDRRGAGIKVWECQDPTRFIQTRCHYIADRYVIQSGLTRLALRRDIGTIIYLGDAQYLTTWLSAAIARLTGKRVLFWTQGWVHRDSGIKNRLRISFYRLAHGLLLYGRAAKMVGIAKNFRPENLHVVYNSLDYDSQKAVRAQITEGRIQEIRAELFPRQHLPMLICVGRLVPVRQLDLLFQALRRLKQEDFETNLLIVGDGPERPRLQGIAEQSGLSVRFYGACYDEAVLAGLIMASNVMVFPGSIGLAAMHALAYGTAVITHDDQESQMPEWEAIVPGRNGDVFRAGDSGDLARVIRDWAGRRLPSAQERAERYEVIERFYNPRFQCQVIERAVAGMPADDEFWRGE